MKVYSLEEGKELVRAARNSVELYLKATSFSRESVQRRAAHLDRHYGAFVSIRHYPLAGLRGQAAFVRGSGPVKNLVVDAALKAASEDKRHVPLSHHELEHIVFEVGIIPDPTRVRGKAQMAKVKAGKEGLVLEYGYKRGFLLPEEISNDYKMPKLLEELCRRAGLDAHDAKREDLVLYRFCAQKFAELEPGGTVEEV